MRKKVHIVAELLLEGSENSLKFIQEKIRNETKIPWCDSIKEIVIEDLNDYCNFLQKRGLSINVVENLIQHFYTD